MPEEFRFGIAVMLLTALSVLPPRTAESAEPENESSSVFDQSKWQIPFLNLQIEIKEAFTEKNPQKAEALIRECLAISPCDFQSHYDLACALALQDRSAEALDALAHSIKCGFRDRRQLRRDPNLSALRSLPRFSDILKQSKSPLPAFPGFIPPEVTAEPILGQTAPVTQSNVVRDFRSSCFRTYFQFPGPPQEAEIATGLSATRQLLRWWNLRGTAAGNHGDLYDNLDGSHSRLGTGQFPGLASITYSDEAIKRSLHLGLQRHFIHGGVTIGNSSTAQVGTVYWRSQPRVAYTTPGLPAFLRLQYCSNQLYIYPEHRDYDPGHNGEGGGYGDVYPAISPYLLISQGSSGSDRPFLEALVSTLAAFRPEVKMKLKNEGALMPVLQMILRLSSRGIKTREKYLSGTAHPPVFDATNLDVLAMARMAQAIETDILPPLMQLEVLEEESTPITGEENSSPPRVPLRAFSAPLPTHAALS